MDAKREDLQSGCWEGGARLFEIGEQIDCEDTVKKWLNAEVVAIRNSEFKVHYSGWSSKYDEWLPDGTRRALKQWRRALVVSANNRLDVRHLESEQWLEARVLQVDDKVPNRVLIHYQGYHKKYDEWVDVEDRERVAEVGTYSKAYGIVI